MSENVQTSGAPQRPTFLTVLCILSFIASGISIVGMLLAGAAKGVVESAGGSELMDQAMEDAARNNPEMQNMPGMDDAMSAVETAFSWPYMIAATVLILVSLFGVIKMWKLKKQGFFIYAGAGIAGIILPLLFGLPFGTFGAIVTLGFIAMYYMNTKVMS